MRTWYGVRARVLPSEHGLCDVAVFGLPLPHPSLINIIIRRGRSPSIREQLFFLHELGHLQTAPLAAMVAVGVFRRPGRRGVMGAVLRLLAVEAVWELLTESYVVWRSGHDYWKGTTPVAIAFWPAMVGLAGTALLFLRPLRPSQNPGSQRSPSPPRRSRA